MYGESRESSLGEYPLVLAEDKDFRGRQPDLHTMGRETHSGRQSRGLTHFEEYRFNAMARSFVGPGESSVGTSVVLAKREDVGKSVKSQGVVAPVSGPRKGPQPPKGGGAKWSLADLDVEQLKRDAARRKADVPKLFDVVDDEDALWGEQNESFVGPVRRKVKDFRERHPPRKSKPNARVGRAKPRGSVDSDAGPIRMTKPNSHAKVSQINGTQGEATGTDDLSAVVGLLGQRHRTRLMNQGSGSRSKQSNPARPSMHASAKSKAKGDPLKEPCDERYCLSFMAGRCQGCARKHESSAQAHWYGMQERGNASMCKAGAIGSCKYGLRCRFQHVPPDQVISSYFAYMAEVQPDDYAGGGGVEETKGDVPEHDAKQGLAPIGVGVRPHGFWSAESNRQAMLVARTARKGPEPAVEATVAASDDAGKAGAISDPAVAKAGDAPDAAQAEDPVLGQGDPLPADAKTAAPNAVEAEAAKDGGLSGLPGIDATLRHADENPISLREYLSAVGDGPNAARHKKGTANEFIVRSAQEPADVTLQFTFTEWEGMNVGLGLFGAEIEQLRAYAAVMEQLDEDSDAAWLFLGPGWLKEDFVAPLCSRAKFTMLPVKRTDWRIQVDISYLGGAEDPQEDVRPGTFRHVTLMGQADTRKVRLRFRLLLPIVCPRFVIAPPAVCCAGVDETHPLHLRLSPAEIEDHKMRFVSCPVEGFGWLDGAGLDVPHSMDHLRFLIGDAAVPTFYDRMFGAAAFRRKLRSTRSLLSYIRQGGPIEGQVRTFEVSLTLAHVSQVAASTTLTLSGLELVSSQVSNFGRVNISGGSAVVPDTGAFLHLVGAYRLAKRGGWQAKPSKV